MQASDGCEYLQKALQRRQWGAAAHGGDKKQVLVGEMDRPRSIQSEETTDSTETEIGLTGSTMKEGCACVRVCVYTHNSKLILHYDHKAQNIETINTGLQIQCLGFPKVSFIPGVQMN